MCPTQEVKVKDLDELSKAEVVQEALCTFLERATNEAVQTKSIGNVYGGTLIAI